MENEKHKWESIFNRDFYPTPENVLIQMQLNIEGEIILEPSAGSGNILDYCIKNGAKDLLFCEINTDLQQICKPKARFLKDDFLKVTTEEISHISQIIMNPPFSKSKEHILHAWNIAPDGCEITTLCNADTLSDLKYYRNELNGIINTYGNTFDIGEVFSTAERKTNVRVSVIKLYKPILSDSENFEGFYSEGEPETEPENGIMKNNEIKTLVDCYIKAVRCFDEFANINEKMKMYCSPIGMDNGFFYSIGYNKNVVSKIDFSKELQRRSWKHIFNKMNLNKYLTSGVMRSVNNFVETQSNIPFTTKNIYRMFEIIVGTKEESFKRALVEAVESFTKHTHENRFGVEGWKTNEGHLLGQKFIINYVFTMGYSGGKLRTQYGSNLEKLNDLTKVLCNITSFDYNKTRSVEQLVTQFEGIEANRWYDNGFFSIKGFKKGTIHIKFQDVKVWEQLNMEYAKIKGYTLPENTFRNNKEKNKPEQETQVRTEMSNEMKSKIRERINNLQTNLTL